MTCISNKTLAYRFMEICVKTFVCIYVGVLCVLMACRGWTKTCQYWSLDGCKQGGSNWGFPFHYFCQNVIAYKHRKKRVSSFLCIIGNANLNFTESLVF